MTVLPWEDPPAPAPPGVNALARTLAGLTQAVWAGGRPQHVTLSKGLTITAYLHDDELHLALTRIGTEPSLEEGETVAWDAGWAGYRHAWQRGRSGTRGLVLTRADRAPPPPPATPGPTDPVRALRALLRRKQSFDLTQDEWDTARGITLPRTEIVVLLLSRPIRSYPPDLAEQARGARTAYLKALSVPELLDELDWFWRHWSRWEAGAFHPLENVMTPPFG